MSQDGSAGEAGTDGEVQCEGCGATFESNRGLKVHESRWCTADADNVLSASEVKVEDLERKIATMDMESRKATLQHYDYQKKDGDSYGSAVAKCLLKELEGGSDQYKIVFGECSEDGCDWGCNGFGADYCLKHQSSTDDDDSSNTEDDENTTEGGDDEPASPVQEDENVVESTVTVTVEDGDEDRRATYVAKLVDKGLSVIDAEKAAEVRFG